ncbi:MAG: hypothetical protein ACMV1B_01295 [Prevotella sp.]
MLDSLWSKISSPGMWQSQVDPETKVVTEAGITPFLEGFKAWNAFSSGNQAANLAQEQLDFTKSAFLKNFNNQVRATNSVLADRQEARLAQGATNTSVADYLKMYGAK